MIIGLAIGFPFCSHPLDCHAFGIVTRGPPAFYFQTKVEAGVVTTSPSVSRRNPNMKEHIVPSFVMAYIRNCIRQFVALSTTKGLMASLRKAGLSTFKGSKVLIYLKDISEVFDGMG